LITYLVDGYNLVHRSYPESIRDGDLERARSELEARVRSFQRARASSVRVVIIWDGQSGLPSGSVREGGFEVEFSRPPKSADDVILDRCRERAARDSVWVVTSDLTDIAGPMSSLGVQHLSSEKFARELEEPASSERARAANRSTDRSEVADDKAASGGGRAVDDWLRDFDLHPDEDSQDG